MDYPKRTHIYKKGKSYNLELDVYLPISRNGKVPVVIFLHGGALIWGSRKGINEAELTAIIEAGIAYVSVDYRLAPETKLMDIQKDVEDAIRWVRGEGARLYGFDAERVTVEGKSAGGYLALLCGTLQDRPNAIVSFYGYGDVLGDWYSLPSPYYLRNPYVSQSEANACVTSGIPTHAGHEERWPLYLRTRQTGSWAPLVSGYGPAEVNAALKPYCPISNIDVRYPPTLLLHGSEDTDVPATQSKDMYKALTDIGIKTQLHIQPGAGHGFDAAWRGIPEEFGLVTRFLKETLL